MPLGTCHYTQLGNPWHIPFSLPFSLQFAQAMADTTAVVIGVEERHAIARLAWLGRNNGGCTGTGKENKQPV